MRQLFQLIFALFILLFITACGGSGGDKKESNSSTAQSSLSSSENSSISPQSLLKTLGDNQIALPDGKVAINPEVQVTDTSGRPVAGIPITFTIIAGAGSIQNVLVTTNAQGHASPGLWILGSSPGLNTLKVMADGIVPVTFTAKAVRSSLDVPITISQYQWKADELIKDGSRISGIKVLSAYIRSTYQLASVSAFINGKKFEMEYKITSDGSTNGWYCSPLSSCFENLSFGPFELVVTASDILGNVSDVVFTPVMDRYPVISNVSLSEQSGEGSASNILSVTCSDDDTSVCNIGVVISDTSIEPPIKIQGTNSITQSMDLSQYKGRYPNIEITATDSQGKTTVMHRNFFVPNDYLSIKHDIGWGYLDGEILDVSGTRIFFRNGQDWWDVVTLNLMDTATGIVSIIEAASINAGDGFLTPNGVLYVSKSPSDSQSGKLYELKNNILTSTDIEGSSLEVKDNWFAYDSKRCNLLTGECIPLNTSDKFDIATNGDVAYRAPDQNIHLLHNNIDHAVTNNLPDVAANFGPMTDGINLVYSKVELCCEPKSIQTILYSDADETVLATQGYVPSFSPDYKLSGGYVAYRKDSQIWRHTPKEEQQVTFFGNLSSISLEAIAPDGAIIVSYNNKRYKSTLGLALQEIGPSLGRVIVRNGKLLIILEQTVLEVK